MVHLLISWWFKRAFKAETGERLPLYQEHNNLLLRMHGSKKLSICLVMQTILFRLNLLLTVIKALIIKSISVSMISIFTRHRRVQSRPISLLRVLQVILHHSVGLPVVPRIGSLITVQPVSRQEQVLS